MIKNGKKNIVHGFESNLKKILIYLLCYLMQHPKFTQERPTVVSAIRDTEIGRKIALHKFLYDFWP